MPRETKVLCLCCNTWMTRHCERSHRLRLETPYSVTQVPAKTTSKLAPITSISSDEGSCSPDLKEDKMDFQLGEAEGPHNDVPERILRSWVSQQQGPLLQESDASGSDNSSSSDENNNEASEDDKVMDEQDDSYPEWDGFETYPEGVPTSDLLLEGYEQEAMAVGMSPHAINEAMILNTLSS
jgi:hypothetical protein